MKMMATKQPIKIRVLLSSTLWVGSSSKKEVKRKITCKVETCKVFLSYGKVLYKLNLYYYWWNYTPEKMNEVYPNGTETAGSQHMTELGAVGNLTWLIAGGRTGLGGSQSCVVHGCIWNQGVKTVIYTMTVPLWNNFEHANLHGLLLTWLEGDFTEHHPDVRKVVLAFNSTGHVIVEWDGDEAGTGVDIVHYRAEWYRCGLPVRLWAEITHHLLKGLYPLGEHVVAVHLNQLGLKGRENEHKSIIMGVI